MIVESYEGDESRTVVKFDPDWMGSGPTFNVSWETFQNILKGKEPHPTQVLKPGEYIRGCIVSEYGVQVYIGGTELPVHP